jgi:hypothetical protein
LLKLFYLVATLFPKDENLLEFGVVWRTLGAPLFLEMDSEKGVLFY